MKTKEEKLKIDQRMASIKFEFLNQLNDIYLNYGKKGDDDVVFDKTTLLAINQVALDFYLKSLCDVLTMFTKADSLDRLRSLVLNDINYTFDTYLNALSD